VEHLNDEELVLAALGETSPGDRAAEVAGHLDHCDHCAAEVAAYRQVVTVARDDEHRGGQPAGPSPRVWAGIVADLGLDDRPAETPSPATVPVGPPVTSAAVPGWTRRRIALLVAAVVVAVGAGIGGGIAIGRSGSTSTETSVVTRATLAALPTGPAGVTGTAAVHQGADGKTLTVSAAHLPLRQGFYQVWLYDAAADKMVPIGTLGPDGSGAFTLTDGIDLRSYNVVDVSAQELNGDPAHGDSVLRGTLTS
jgi:hypothetical protein